MAAYEVLAAEHGAYAKTLAANTEDAVTFDKDIDAVEVWSDGTEAIYFTVDGTDPTVGGAGAWEVPKGSALVRECPVPTAGNTIVKLISAGTPKYSVTEVSY